MWEIEIVRVDKLFEKKRIPEVDPFDGPTQRQSKAFHAADNFDSGLAYRAYKERQELIYKSGLKT